MGKKYLKPEEVRAESLTYELAVLNALSNIQRLIPTIMDKDRYTDWYSLEASIMGLDAMVAPYYHEEYLADRTTIKSKIRNARKGFNKQDYMEAMAEWIHLIVKRFGQVNILPAIRVTQTAVPTTKMKPPKESEKDAEDATVDKE